MKVWSVSMVRNEADIVEAWVRHNLGVVDGMAIVDHGSFDRTPAILRALAGEALPLVLIESATPGYLQEQMTTSVARRLLAEAGADYVVPLDADEFLKVRSREDFRRALAAVSPSRYGLLHWLTYVPDFDAPAGDVVARIAGARRLARERHNFHKALLTRRLLEQPEAMLANGNHFVARRLHGRSEDAEPHARVRAEHAAIAHVPIRGAESFVAKVAIKKLGRIAARNDWRPEAASQAAYEAIVAGTALDAAALRAHAVNWSLPNEARVDPASVELVDDPFLAPVRLRYTPPGPAPALPLVASAVERMARRLAAARVAARGHA